MPWCAESPHHVTSIFVPHPSTSPLLTGSVGAGLVVEPRLRACLPGPSEPPTSTARRALALLGAEPSGSYLAPLPPGKGYAVSAASAVAAALASSSPRGKTGVLEALRAAHVAEVLERTGLGDVAAISCGVGVALRLQPGAPGLGRVECIPVPRSIGVIAAEAPGTMHTSRLLSLDLLHRARGLAERLLSAIFEERSVEAFARASTAFTQQLGLARRVLGERAAEALRRLPGLIGYYAKKRVALALVEEDRLGDALEALGRVSGITVRLLRASESGPRVWWDYEV